MGSFGSEHGWKRGNVEPQNWVRLVRTAIPNWLRFDTARHTTMLSDRPSRHWTGTTSGTGNSSFRPIDLLQRSRGKPQNWVRLVTWAVRDWLRFADCNPPRSRTFELSRNLEEPSPQDNIVGMPPIDSANFVDRPITQPGYLLRARGNPGPFGSDLDRKWS